MGDLKEDYLAMNELKKERKKKRYDKNLEIFRLFKLNFTTQGHTAFFREEGKPKVDYYLTTNKWKFDNNRVYFGDASSFYKWYQKQ